MFPFSNSDTNLESFFKTPSFLLQDQIQNPTSKQDDSHFFPSPFLNEQELPLNQIFQTDEKIPDPNRQKTDDHQPRRRKNPATAPRKRTGKKDRHSKICTAQGIRDRRMRLSLQVARKFFDLQDMLGYDKASKTIEWLFNQSNKAIKELVQDMSDAKSESLLSECEVVSGIEESSNKEGLVLSEKKADSREKARMMGKQEMEDQMQLIKSSPKSMNLEKLGFCSNKLFDGDDQELVMGYGVDDCSPLEYQPSDSGTIEKLLGSSSSSDFMGFFGSWDGLLSNERLSYGVTNFQALM